MKFLASAKEFIKNFRRIKSTRFRIEKINLKKRTVEVFCFSLYTVMKLSLEDAILDEMLISNLSSKQACWLGYYYGRSYFSKGNKNTFSDAKRSEKNKSHSSLIDSDAREKNKSALIDSNARFKICYQNREGDVTYYDKKTKNQFTASPISLCQNEFLIANFDSTQACHVGILAGLSSINKKSQQRNRSSEPHLQLVT